MREGRKPPGSGPKKEKLGISGMPVFSEASSPISRS
jgi:hypothetical protein